MSDTYNEYHKTRIHDYLNAFAQGFDECARKEAVQYPVDRETLRVAGISFALMDEHIGGHPFKLVMHTIEEAVQDITNRRA